MNLKAGEKVWARENGLKKTGMKTFEYGKFRNVYRANDGRLFYIVDRSFHGTYESKCFEMMEQFKTCEWMLCEKEIKAVKKILEYYNYNPNCWVDYYVNTDVVIMDARNERCYAWLYTGRHNAIIDIETLEIIDDEDFISDQLC